MQSPKRKLKRLRSLKAARLILDGRGGGGVDCSIVDMNSRGMKLRFASFVPAPKEFTLLLLPENINVKARRAWQDGNYVGIELDVPLDHLVRHDVPDRSPS